MRRYRRKLHQSSLAVLSAVLGTVIVGGLPLRAQNQDQTFSESKLEKENQELRERLDKLDDLLKKEGITPSGDNAATQPVKALSAVNISGFVTASYFYDVGSSKDSHPVGYLWNTAMNQFTLNKVEMTLASPAVSKDKWDAAYKVTLLYGQDATVDNSSSGKASAVGYDAIRQAYIELNVPIGTGLDIQAGELISLLNYESGNGGVDNDNFSQGYQWWYTGNGPAGGVQLAYDFNDMFGIKARLENGLYTGEVSSGSKTFMGGFYVKPDKKTSLAFLGFEGTQNFAPAWDLIGGSFIGSRQLMESHNVTLAVEGDYFQFNGFDSTVAGFPGGANHGNFWSGGVWLGADLAPKWRVGLRGDYLDDPTGFGTIYNSPNPASLEYGSGGFPTTIYTSGAGQQLMSVTLTLNYTPAPYIKIQPELRWDHSTFNGAFGKSDQFIVGMGVSYLF